MTDNASGQSVKRAVAAAAITTALLAPFTALLPERVAEAAAGGMCSPRNAPHLVASGTWTPSSFALAGIRQRPRFGRDTWTDITVGGRTYRDVGPATTIRRHTSSGLLARVVFRTSYGAKDWTCTFRLARAR